MIRLLFGVLGGVIMSLPVVLQIKRALDLQIILAGK